MGMVHLDAGVVKLQHLWLIIVNNVVLYVPLIGVIIGVILQGVQNKNVLRTGLKRVENTGDILLMCIPNPDWGDTRLRKRKEGARLTDAFYYPSAWDR